MYLIQAKAEICNIFFVEMGCGSSSATTAVGPDPSIAEPIAKVVEKIVYREC